MLLWRVVLFWCFLSGNQWVIGCKADWGVKIGVLVIGLLDGATIGHWLVGATHPGLRPPLSERGWAAASY